MRTRRLMPLMTVGASLMTLFATAVASAQPADTIYHGGTIITVNDDQPTAEAVAVKGGKIIAVGKEADVLKTKGDATKLIDLKGRTMASRLRRCSRARHGCGLQALSANILAPPDGEVKDIASLQQTLRDWIVKNQEAVDKSSWSSGLDTTMRSSPSSGTRPVKTWTRCRRISRSLSSDQSGHLIAVNSVALELGGITAETPNPPGGVIQRGDDGKEPNRRPRRDRRFSAVDQAARSCGAGRFRVLCPCRRRTVGEFWLHHGTGRPNHARCAENPQVGGRRGWIQN